MHNKFARYTIIWLLIIATVFVADEFIRNVFLTGDKPRAVTPRGSLTDLEKSTINLFNATAPSVVIYLLKDVLADADKAEGELAQALSGTGQDML